MRRSHALRNLVVSYEHTFLIFVDLGVDGICAKLKVDVKVGLDGQDFDQRTEQFGNNYREPL